MRFKERTKDTSRVVWESARRWAALLLIHEEDLNIHDSCSAYALYTFLPAISGDWKENTWQLGETSSLHTLNFIYTA